MQFGDRDTFAVLFDIDEPKTEWLFGKFGYVVNGCLVGNYDNGCTLRGVIGALKDLTENRGRRKSAELMRLNAEEASGRIDGALYVDSGQSDEVVAADRDFYWRFQVKHTGLEVFDGWKCYLIENNASARLIWCDQKRGTSVSEGRMASGEFDNVLETFISYIENVYGAVMWPSR